MTTQFTWIPLYEELAKELINWKDKQSELIQFLSNLSEQGYVITKLNDKSQDGEVFRLKEIDPFTFFGVFNRGIKKEQRIAILSEIKQFFNLSSAVPSDFDGIPILNNMSSWFIAYERERDLKDVNRLWNVFQLAQEENPLENRAFLEAFDEAMEVKQTNINLTMGLFWIRPEIFINLDQRNRTYLNIELPSGGLSSKFYREVLLSLKGDKRSFPEISLAAWKATQSLQGIVPGYEINYWLVGAYWDDKDPPDQTERFLAEGIWENGYSDRYLEVVKSIKVGDKIGIKSSGTQKLGLPFDNRGKTISRNTIKAIGTVVSNRGDGRTLEVEWDPNFHEKNWYFYTARTTIWHVRNDNRYPYLDLSQKLIDFVWYANNQDYDWFMHRWFDTEPGETSGTGDTSGDEEVSGATAQAYSIEDLISSGVFLTKPEINLILSRLKDKKAMIIQGPPGVGKTFIARNLAYALMEEKDTKRVEVIEFHQSYSYEDFVRGYRPNPDQLGTFAIRNGIFYEFCQKAINDPEREYVFIIDEINRGNLSQIFGELLMLIENDKRGKEHAVPLVYRNADEPRFYVPGNLYILGLMNLADRSLAMVDYALRRRFAFITLKPQFQSELYKHWLEDREMDSELIELVINRLSKLNEEILSDPLLGGNYQVGHSYFCPRGDDFSGLTRSWYENIIRTEIIPLLEEYWFDNREKVEDMQRRLLA